MAKRKSRRALLRARCAARARTLRLEQLEVRRLLAADAMHNLVRPADINDDGRVDAADIFMAVERIRDRHPSDGNHRDGYFDVNGDGRFNVADPLSAIDSFRRGRGEPSPIEEDEVRSIDGSGNNERYVDWGEAGSEYLRLVEPDYADGLSEPSGEDRPNARDVSNIVLSQEESIENERGLSDLFWQWGQFLDHDLDLTAHADPAESLNIEVPAGDAWFDPFGTGEAEIPLSRSEYDPSTGDRDARQQVNSITAFIDGSQIYGSDAQQAALLRSFEGGRLSTSEGDLLPINEEGFFMAGDVRANEQVGLTAMHTIWVREHNRIADRIAAEHPELEDEAIYQQTRTLVIAQLQAITYNEFLPALLGRDALQRYDGYDSEVNPGISNLFSTAAYRFGHSMLSSELLRLNENGETAKEGNLELRSAFFSPEEITAHGVDSLLRGLAANQAQEIDAQVVDDIRNFLFGPPGAGGFDLASLNIQRGRDHGLPGFNDVREQLGLGRVESFADISSDPATQQTLEAAYGDVDLIDVWVGMLAEDHVRGAAIGETARTVLVDQFERLRDDDRFWYQRVLSGEQLRQVESTTLADVIERNTAIDGLQDNVFFTADHQPERERTKRSGERHDGHHGEAHDDRPTHSPQHVVVVPTNKRRDPPSLTPRASADGTTDLQPLRPEAVDQLFGEL